MGNSVFLVDWCLMWEPKMAAIHLLGSAPPHYTLPKHMVLSLSQLLYWPMLLRNYK